MRVKYYLIWVENLLVGLCIMNLLEVSHDVSQDRDTQWITYITSGLSLLIMFQTHILHFANRLTLSCLVARRWNSVITAPSNSEPLLVFTVAGKKAFHMMVSQVLVAMKLNTSYKTTVLISFLNGT